MADTDPQEPTGAPTPDAGPRLGPHGELVSEDGHYYWTGRHWEPLAVPFPPLASAGRAPGARTYDTTIVSGVAIVAALVLSVGVSVLVFAFPPAIVLAPVLVVAAAVFLGLAKDKTHKSWAIGLLIGSGVALLISPGAACFGLVFGPSVS